MIPKVDDRLEQEGEEELDDASQNQSQEEVIYIFFIGSQVTVEIPEPRLFHRFIILVQEVGCGLYQQTPIPWLRHPSWC